MTFYVPEKLPDGLNYDISKVQPAPSKKLKLDWVSSIRCRVMLIILNFTLILGLRISWKRLPF